MRFLTKESAQSRPFFAAGREETKQTLAKRMAMRYNHALPEAEDKKERFRGHC